MVTALVSGSSSPSLRPDWVHCALGQDQSLTFVNIGVTNVTNFFSRATNVSHFSLNRNALAGD